jgi:hypothetical protein
MREHARDDELMDVVEGTASAEVRRHVLECASCHEKLAEASEGLDLARAADVPEPSPVFWESFRRQVGHRVGEGTRWRMVAWAPALAAAAALALGIGVLKPGPDAVQPVSTLPAWSASLTADDPFAQLETTDSDALAAAACRRLADCLTGLSEEETSALAEVLSDELSAGGDL